MALTHRAFAANLNKRGPDGASHSTYGTFPTPELELRASNVCMAKYGYELCVAAMHTDLWKVFHNSPSPRAVAVPPVPKANFKTATGMSGGTGREGFYERFAKTPCTSSRPRLCSGVSNLSMCAELCATRLVARHALVEAV